MGANRLRPALQLSDEGRSKQLQFGVPGERLVKKNTTVREDVHVTTVSTETPLPLHRSGAYNPTTMSAIGSPEVRGGNETVLLVEPDPETRALAAFMLRRLGYTVLEARHANDAIAAYEEQCGSVDLLLTEAVMTRTNGHDLAELLRQHNPALRVLYLADAQYERLTRRVALEKKLLFLVRPFTMSQFAPKVREALDAPGLRVAMAGSSGIY
jgi:CheY-like chemotaxis protein